MLDPVICIPALVILAVVILFELLGSEGPVILLMIAYAILRCLWEAFGVGGAWLVRLVRDLPIMLFRSNEWSNRTVRLALVFWLVLFPILALMLMILLVHHQLGWIGTLVLLPFLARAIFGYYHEILKGTIRQERLPRFVKEYYLMRAEARMSWVCQSTQARFWLAQKIKEKRGKR